MPTPTQVYDQVRNHINESGTNFLGESELYQNMWEAEIEIADEVGCAETTDSSTTTASGTREYAKPSGCLQIKRLTYDSYPLQKINFAELDKYEGVAYAHADPTGNVIYYYEYGNKVGLSPVPDAIKTLKFWLIVEPTALNSSSTAFTIPDSYAGGIYHYCLWRYFKKDHKSVIAKGYMNSWEAAKASLKIRWAKKKLGGKEIIVKDADVFENRTTF